MKLMDIEGEQLSNLKSILEFALSDDRYQIYDFVLSKGERRWSELGAADWSQMGGTQLLLNPAWSRYFFEDGKSLSALDSLQRRWFIVKQLWGQTPVDRQWKATQDPSVVESSASFILWVLVLGTGVFAAIVGVRWWRLRDTLSVKATDDWDLREFIASLEELGPNNNFDWLLKGLNRRLRDQRGGIDWMLLSEIEREVLQASLAGLGTKEIAVASNRSTASVYNIRSRIRQKLNVPEDMSLDEWCMQFKTKAEQ